MANDVYASVYFNGDNIEDFKKALKECEVDGGLTTKIDMDKLCKLFKVPTDDERYQERFYVIDVDYDLEDGGVLIETWNAWFPREETWSFIANTYDDGAGLYYHISAYDADNIYHCVNTDYSGEYFKDKYKVVDSDFYDYYFSTLDEVKDYMEAEGIEDYTIIKIPDEIEMFSEPHFVNLDGEDVDAPEDYC